VSLLWRKKITITLSPTQVEVVHRFRRLHSVVEEPLILPCSPTCTDPNWRSALEALRTWLAAAPRTSTDTHIVLSNHFVRYLLIPWKPDLITQQERLAFARARFIQVFGDVADTWVLKLSGVKSTAAAVASAVDQALLDSLNTAMANSALRLRSIQPGLMAAFNARLRGTGGSEWMVVAEPGRLVVGLLSRGEWRCLRSRPVNGQALSEIIRREQLLAGVDPTNARVHIYQINGTSLDSEAMNAEYFLPKNVAQPAQVY
jgi:hypothetical protein